jgi:hypothetical protein
VARLLAGTGFADPNDPLVTPPGAGINGWVARVTGAARRSWRSLLLIMNRIGMVLGRLALVAAVVIGGSLAISLLENLGLLAVGPAAGLSVGAVVITVGSMLLQLPL